MRVCCVSPSGLCRTETCLLSKTFLQVCVSGCTSSISPTTQSCCCPSLGGRFSRPRIAPVPLSCISSRLSTTALKCRQGSHAHTAVTDLLQPCTEIGCFPSIHCPFAKARQIVCQLSPLLSCKFMLSSCCFHNRLRPFQGCCFPREKSLSCVTPGHPSEGRLATFNAQPV